MERPQLGTWHTIRDRAIKKRTGNRVIWIEKPIEDKDYRRQPIKTITEYQGMYIGYRFKLGVPMRFKLGNLGGKATERCHQDGAVSSSRVTNRDTLWAVHLGSVAVVAISCGQRRGGNGHWFVTRWLRCT